MSYRKRLLLAFALTVAATAALVSYAISAATTAAFERLGDQQTRILTSQFQREFDWRGRDVVRRLEAISASESLRHLAADLAHAGADPAPYVDIAAGLAREQGLDFLDIVDRAGAIVSSAHYPARFGYRKEWVTEPVDWNRRSAFVDAEEIPDGSATALLGVRTAGAPGAAVFVIGGRRLDSEFLESIPLPPGIRAGLSFSPPEQASGARIPLTGRSQDAAVSLVLSGARPELAQLRSIVWWLGAGGAGLGLLAGLAVAWWASSLVTRPVLSLAEGAREVAAGNWNARVEVTSRDELGELAGAFNRMTAELAQQHDRLIQAERVAAWRELARRLAHELKNPLFPLQITLENLQRARLQHPDQFDEVFRESTTTLLAEIANLRQIVARFSDFAKLPVPRLEPVELGVFLEEQVRLFDAQWQGPEQRICAEILVSAPGLTVEADPELLGRAVRNLVLNAMDAMPGGGRIAIHAFRRGSSVILEVADTGTGLTPEECDRLFTPYYTTKQHGTGLGLAIVQSVVADHGGRISVTSTPGRGSTFTIEFPEGSRTEAPSKD